jgi:hypothetical protein
MKINILFYSYWINNIYNRSKFIAINSSAVNRKYLGHKSWRVIVTQIQLPLRHLPSYRKKCLEDHQSQAMWTEPNRTDLNWTELNWTELNRTDLKWTELKWTEMNRTGLNWTELNQTQLTSTELNWTELNRTDLNWTELNETEPNPTDLNWNELNRPELTWTELNPENTEMEVENLPIGSWLSSTRIMIGILCT